MTIGAPLTRRTALATALTIPLVNHALAGHALAAADDELAHGIKLASDYLNNTGNDLDQAARMIAAAVDSQPLNPAAWYGQGFVSRAHGDHQASLTAFNNALMLDPGDYKARAQTGAALINLGRIDEAASPLTEALRTADTSRAGIYAFNLGRAHYFARQYRQAAEWCWRALKIRPELTFIGAYLATALELDGADPYAARAVLAKYPGLTRSEVADGERRNPSGSVLMREARERLHASLERLKLPA